MHWLKLQFEKKELLRVTKENVTNSELYLKTSTTDCDYCVHLDQVVGTYQHGLKQVNDSMS